MDFLWSWIPKLANLYMFQFLFSWMSYCSVLCSAFWDCTSKKYYLLESLHRDRIEKYEDKGKILSTQLLNACNWNLYVRMTLAVCVWILFPKGAHFSLEGEKMVLFICANSPESLVHQTQTHTWMGDRSYIRKHVRLIVTPGNEMQLSSVSVCNACLLQCSFLCLCFTAFFHAVIM